MEPSAGGSTSGERRAGASGRRLMRPGINSKRAFKARQPDALRVSGGRPCMGGRARACLRAGLTAPGSQALIAAASGPGAGAASAANAEGVIYGYRLGRTGTAGAAVAATQQLYVNRSPDARQCAPRPAPARPRAAPGRRATDCAALLELCCCAAAGRCAAAAARTAGAQWIWGALGRRLQIGTEMLPRRVGPPGGNVSGELRLPAPRPLSLPRQCRHALRQALLPRDSARGPQEPRVCADASAVGRWRAAAGGGRRARWGPGRAPGHRPRRQCALARIHLPPAELRHARASRRPCGRLMRRAPLGVGAGVVRASARQGRGRACCPCRARPHWASRSMRVQLGAQVMSSAASFFISCPPAVPAGCLLPASPSISVTCVQLGRD